MVGVKTWLVIVLSFAYAMGSAWDQYLKDADQYMKQGQYGKALVQLQKARSLDSQQVNLDSKIRECQIRLGSWIPGQNAASMEWIEVDKLRLQEVPEKSYDSLLQVAKSLEDRENYEVALKILAYIAEKAPAKQEYAKVHQSLRLKLDKMVVNYTEVGDVFLKQGRFGEARDEFRRGLFFRPNDAYLQDRLKLVESKQGEMIATYRSQLKASLAKQDAEASLAIADRAFRDFPDDRDFRRVADSLRSLHESDRESVIQECRSLLAKGEIGSAESKLREALVKYPGDPTVMQMQADALRALEQKRKAGLRDSLEKQFLASMQAGNIGLGAMQLQRMKIEFPGANLSILQKQLDQQKNQFQRQRDFENLLEIARRNSQDGLIAQSKEALLNALKIEPESPVAKQMLADIQKEESRQTAVEEQRRKDLQKAEALLAAGQIQSAKKVDLSLSGVGKVDQEVKQVQRNIREAEFARTPEKDRRAQEIFLEGIAKYRVGDYEEALEKWKQVLQLNPDHDQAKKYMANVKQKLSRMQ